MHKTLKLFGFSALLIAFGCADDGGEPRVPSPLTTSEICEPTAGECPEGCDGVWLRAQQPEGCYSAPTELWHCNAKKFTGCWVHQTQGVMGAYNPDTEEVIAVSHACDVEPNHPDPWVSLFIVGAERCKE